jgi:hypothetical protein
MTEKIVISINCIGYCGERYLRAKDVARYLIELASTEAIDVRLRLEEPANNFIKDEL